MIPRHQKIMFAFLLAGTCLMGMYLLHLRARAADRMHTNADPNAPMSAPSYATQSRATLVLADDASDSLRASETMVPLPATASAQARSLLAALLADYAKPLSQHPLPGGNAVTDVFLLPLQQGETSIANLSGSASAPPVVAIVNLDRSFAEQHPSGITVESLTIRSIAATLHENLPQIKQVRFLVEGHTRDTLAGHADLSRTYSAVEETADPVNGTIH